MVDYEKIDLALKLGAIFQEIERHAESGMEWLEMNHADYEEIRRLAKAGSALLEGAQPLGVPYSERGT